MPRLLRPAVACLGSLLLSTALSAVTWVCSTESEPSRTMPAPGLAPLASGELPQLRVFPAKTAQRIEGFGGCFNELGWVALEKASAADRQAVLSALFGDEGAAFNLARIPIGASDFALDGYSLADTPGDYELKSFSVARDEKHLLPYIRAAQAVRPDLRSWASPWSPPAWMKDNNSYSKGSLRQEPAVLRAYAEYFARWAEAYRALGVPIYAISPQNEPNIASPYPTCLWTGPQLRDFIGDYLGPVLSKRAPGIELWLGLNGDPFNDGENPNARLVPVLEDPKASAFIAGVAFQYDSRNQIALASRLYPEKKFMQSETACNGGANSWGDAQKLFGLMKRYLEGGAGSYFAWNMVLDETGLSTWNWKQNALVTVDRADGRVTYNGEFHVMRHFSHFVKPGARRVLSAGGWGDQIAFINPDGSLVAVVGNASDRVQPFSLAFGGAADAPALSASLPPRSISTFVLPSPSS